MMPAKDNRGMILVFTMILMAGLLSTAVGFSFFIISDINQARAIDDSIVAYYAADSGMERSLFVIFKQQESEGKKFESMEELKRDKEGDILSDSLAKWDISDSTDYERNFFRQRLYNGQGSKFYILNRSEGKPKSFLLYWKKGLGTLPKLQVSLTQLSPQSKVIDQASGDSVMVYYTDTSEVENSDSYSADASGIPTCYNFKDENINGGASNPAPSDYVVEVKALGESSFDYIDQISISTYDKPCYSPDYADSLNLKGITNLTIKSKGTYNNTQQSIVAHLPPRNVPSGLLGFVLFSEQAISKE